MTYWEPTAQDLEYLNVVGWDYMYMDHAGAAGESIALLKQEHNAVVKIFLWFMREHNLHIGVNLEVRQ